MAYYQYDYSSEHILDINTPFFAEPAAVFNGSGLYSDNAAPIAGDAGFPTRTLDDLSREFFWLASSAAAEDSQQPLTDYAWGLPPFDSGSSVSPAAVSPSLKRKRSALDDTVGGTDLATREEGLRPSKIARPSPDLPGVEAAFDAEPLVLGWVSDSGNSDDLDGLAFDMAPGFQSFRVPESLLSTDLPAPDNLHAPDFYPDFLLIPNFVSTAGAISTFDALDAFMSPQRAVSAELAREVSADDEPPVRTPEGRRTEDAAVPAIPPADERAEENVDAASPSSESSAPTADPEPEVAQPAPRPLQWVVKNPGNQMGLEEDRRIGQTDFWCADAPAEHRHYRRSQPCDIPGCDVRFEPGNAASFAFHDGRTAGHKRLRYHCPRPGCNGTYGRADSMKRHLKDKQVCGDFVLGVLQPIYGQEAVPDIPRLAEWQVLPHFATMRS